MAGRRPKHLDVDTGFFGPKRRVLATEGTYLSSNGRAQHRTAVNIPLPTLAARRPSDLRDHVLNWRPMPSISEAPEGVEDPATTAADEAPPVAGMKRKAYESSTNPGAQWLPLKSTFLDELIRHEALNSPTCVDCRATYTREDPSPTRIFRCLDCGLFTRCLTCTTGSHALSPLHEVEEWLGDFWSPVSLAAIGVVYQLGHGGLPCPSPDPFFHSMTIVDAPFIRKATIRYCACPMSFRLSNAQQLLRNAWYPATVIDPATCATFRTLRAFRLYNAVGNLNTTDFVTAMERMTNPAAASGVDAVPDRTRQMHRMSRQWGHLMQLKRAGRGHDPAGVAATSLGGCAVLCWACPHEGRNLPADWNTVSPEYRFLYMLILAMDANFRLKNRIRKNEIDDGALGAGYAYWVEPGAYKDHVRKGASEADITTCVAFAALLQKETRQTAGLRVSGVGGCVCARHECVRPNGLGDLQKGERYCNMDWIFFSAIMALTIVALTISYDIACQWKINLEKRMRHLPPSMQRNLAEMTVQYGLPVWHAPAHTEECQEENDLSLKPGVGKTDGEGIERFWAGMNPVAYSTKEMGLGHRADVIDDRIDNHNFLKNLTLGSTLQRRLVVARDEYLRQKGAFDVVNEGIENDLQHTWTREVREWERDSKNPNPYARRSKDCLTEAQIRLQLQREEKQVDTDGRASIAGASATSFLAAGIQIEDAQQRLLRHLRSPYLITANHELKTDELRESLVRKIDRFRDLQAIYVPGAASLLQSAEAQRDPNAEPTPPEQAQLFMPSQMPWVEGSGLQGCLSGLSAIEERQRVAQCENSLSQLRSHLHAKRWLVAHRNANLVGQRQTTRAAKLFEQLAGQTQFIADRYGRGYAALESLRVLAKYPHIHKLTPDDITVAQDRDLADLDARKKLAGIGARHSRASRNIPGRTKSKSKRILSWIWTGSGAFDDEERHLHDSMRVEWALAMARRDRWAEEVLLLEEEMRRVLRYLDWQSTLWRANAQVRVVQDPLVAAGLRAYALKSAFFYQRLRTYFANKWLEGAGRVLHRLQRSPTVDTEEDSDVVVPN